MMKKFLIIFLLVFLGINTVYAKDAETLGDLRREYQSVLNKQKEYNNKSEQAKQEIKNKEAAIAKAQEELTLAEHEEEETKLAIAESNERIEQLKLESEKVLQYMQQMQSKNAYVEYVTGSSSMTELITRLEAIKQVSGYIQDTLDNLEAEIKRNEQLVIELKEKQKALDEKITNYQAAIAKLETQAEEYNEFALSLDEEVAAAKELLDANVRICKETIGKTDDNVKLADCSKMPINGGWLKPLKSGVVTSPQGYRTHPVTGKVYSFHDGIDIGVSEGTPVYAAASGQVVAKVARSTCGGNKLFINVNIAGVQYTTWYYHLLRFNVEVGDIVTTDTIIGYVGGYSTSSRHGGYDTCTTGAHLHFGVQKGYYLTNGGVKTSSVIVPPGFNNKEGYRFTNRTDFYQG